MSDDDNKRDLTRIEDLSEFMHQGDEEFDKLLSDLNEEDEQGDTSSSQDLQDIDSDDEEEIQLSSFEFDTPESSDDFSETEDESNEFDDFPNFEEESEEEETEFETGFDESALDDSLDDFDNTFEDDNEEIEEIELTSEDQFEDNGQDFDEEENFTNDEIEDEGEAEFSEELEEEEEQELSEPLQEDTSSNVEQTTPQEQITPPKSPTPPENFEEVRDFATNSTYGKVAIGGNPPFSILMQGIRPEEYDESILAILSEHGILADNEELYRQSLASGQLLIAQIGEFSAVFLAGKLRKYCRTIKVALAHEIHLSKSYDHDDQRGLTGPKSITQNKTKRYNRNELKFDRNDILLSSSQYIPGYLVSHSLGPMQLNEKIDASEFDDINSINLIDFFEDRMRDAALEKGANAITSIHFTINQQEIKNIKYIIILAHGDYVTLEEHNESGI